MSKFKVKIYEDTKGKYIKLKNKKVYIYSELSNDISFLTTVVIRNNPVKCAKPPNDSLILNIMR